MTKCIQVYLMLFHSEMGTLYVYKKYVKSIQG